MRAKFLLNAWDVGTFLQKGGQTLEKWAGFIIIIIGIIMLLAAAYLIAKGLLGQGKGQPVPWVTIGLLIVIGGAFLATGGGFAFLKEVAGGGKKTIEDLGKNVIIPLLYLR